MPLFDDATLSALCAKAFVAPARDGAPIGGKCTLSGDCAASGDEAGQVTCCGHACILQREGASGEGPCYAGGNSALQACAWMVRALARTGSAICVGSPTRRQ